MQTIRFLQSVSYIEPCNPKGICYPLNWQHSREYRLINIIKDDILARILGNFHSFHEKGDLGSLWETYLEKRATGLCCVLVWRTLRTLLHNGSPVKHQTVTKTRLYNFDPLKPHFYTVKLGFTGVYIILLISAQKHRLWVLIRTASPRRF